MCLFRFLLHSMIHFEQKLLVIFFYLFLYAHQCALYTFLYLICLHLHSLNAWRCVKSSPFSYQKKKDLFSYVVTQNLGREDTKFQTFFLEPENDKDAILLKLYKWVYNIPICTHFIQFYSTHIFLRVHRKMSECVVTSSFKFRFSIRTRCPISVDTHKHMLKNGGSNDMQLMYNRYTTAVC